MLPCFAQEINLWGWVCGIPGLKGETWGTLGVW